MPELPEVEAVVRALLEDGIERSPLTAARMIRPQVTRPQEPQAVERLSTGVKVRQARRRAKNIVLDLSNGYSLRIHLRMTGDLRIEPSAEPPAAVVRAEWSMRGNRRLVFADPRALGRVHIYPTDELDGWLDRLGPEPLSGAFTKEAFQNAARASRLPAKLFLMDQTRVAGLGNIYTAEALFRAGISPLRTIRSISRVRLERLRIAIRETLETAVHSIYKAYRSPGGYRENHDGFERLVYRRAGEPCTRCGRPIRRVEQGGRSTYFCPRCQR